jgi:hypothetical protein
MDRIYGIIIAYPERWNQDTWATQTDCGTAYCIAGFAAVLTGWTAEFTHRGMGNGMCYRKDTNERMLINEVARKALGLSVNQSHDLFSAYNDLSDIEEIMKELS